MLKGNIFLFTQNGVAVVGGDVQYLCLYRALYPQALLTDPAVVQPYLAAAVADLQDLCLRMVGPDPPGCPAPGAAADQKAFIIRPFLYRYQLLFQSIQIGNDVQLFFLIHPDIQT